MDVQQAEFIYNFKNTKEKLRWTCACCLLGDREQTKNTSEYKKLNEQITLLIFG